MTRSFASVVENIKRMGPNNRIYY